MSGVFYFVSYAMQSLWRPPLPPQYLEILPRETLDNIVENLVETNLDGSLNYDQLIRLVCSPRVGRTLWRAAADVILRTVSLWRDPINHELGFRLSKDVHFVALRLSISNVELYKPRIVHLHLEEGHTNVANAQADILHDYITKAFLTSYWMPKVELLLTQRPMKIGDALAKLTSIGWCEFSCYHGGDGLHFPDNRTRHLYFNPDIPPPFYGLCRINLSGPHLFETAMMPWIHALAGLHFVSEWRVHRSNMSALQWSAFLSALRTEALIELRVDGLVFSDDLFRFFRRCDTIEILEVFRESYAGPAHIGPPFLGALRVLNAPIRYVLRMIETPGLLPALEELTVELTTGSATLNHDIRDLFATLPDTVNRLELLLTMNHNPVGAIVVALSTVPYIASYSFTTLVLRCGSYGTLRHCMFQDPDAMRESLAELLVRFPQLVEIILLEHDLDFARDPVDVIQTLNGTHGDEARFTLGLRAPEYPF